MTRRSFHFAPLVAILIAATLSTSSATAQNPAVLAEVYGQGVHAYYAGRYNDAYNLLSSAIDSGTRDPRAYYFRGIVAYQQGRPEEARADWTEGAQLEARQGGGAFVGRSLSRFQGSPRLELEAIRQQARLDAAKEAASRSDARMRQLGVAPSANPGAAPAGPGTAPAAGAVTPPPPAPAAPQPADPFTDDGPAMAAGEPNVESPNALEGLDDNPFKDDPVPGGEAADAGAMPAAGGNPFDGGTPAAGNDPFGAPAGGGNDPFGAPAGGGNDPFGAPPAGGNDPFGGDPFGN
jgi:hypothetical protein